MVQQDDRESAQSVRNAAGKRAAIECARRLHHTVEVIPISLVAIGIGILSAFVALALLRLIGVFTNLFFYLRWSAALSLRLALIWV